MIESWTNILIGIMVGVGGTIIAVTLFCMIKMNFDFMVSRKVWDHEEKYHAEELKERDKK